MELTDIMALVKAGYTKDEITQMDTQKTPDTNTEPVQLAMDIPTQITEPEPIPSQVNEPVATPTPAPEKDQPTMADLMQSIAKLTSAVQANAIAQSVIPGGMNTQPTAEDMLAEIIRPTFKER